MFKKMLMIGILAFTVVGLGACGGNSDSPSESGTDAALQNREETVSAAPEDESSAGNESSTSNESSIEKKDEASEANVLIAYFSWSGNTRQLAGMIQELTGGELFEIESETPYTDDINALSGISLQEQRDDIRPALKSTVEDMDQYNVIFIGFPNWWNNMPMPVFTFLEEYDFSGKTVIPFTTYGNGGWGRSIGSIQEALPESDVLDGLAVQEHELKDALTEVAEWVQGLCQFGFSFDNIVNPFSFENGNDRTKNAHGSDNMELYTGISACGTSWEQRDWHNREKVKKHTFYVPDNYYVGISLWIVCFYFERAYTKDVFGV